MSEGTPEQREAADNVAAFFDRTGQSSVSAERFLVLERARIVEEARQVAGRGGRVSWAEIRLLPKELHADVRAIRTAPTSSANPPPRPAGLAGAIARATVGLTFPSESDAVLRTVSAADPQGRAITPALIENLFGSASVALGENIFGPNNGLPSIVGRAAETRDAMALLQRLSSPSDPGDPVSVANADRWHDLSTLFSNNLTELTAVRFGEPRNDGSVGINVSLFIVGRHNTGDIVGIYTGAVET